MCVNFASPLMVVEYLHCYVLKDKSPTVIWMVDVLRWGCCLLYIWNTRLDGMALCGLVGGYTVLYSHNYLFRTKDFYPDVSGAGSPQRAILKDTDKSNMVDLNGPWRIFVFLVVTNWFHCNGDAKEYSRIVLYYCGIPYRNFSLTNAWGIKVHHQSQLTDLLEEVDLKITMVMSKMLLVTIFTR